MINFLPDQNIADEKSDIIVNTVNTVGVMGKGVALAIKDRYPDVMTPYQDACKSGRLQPGGAHIHRLDDGRVIVNLATKKDWRDPSRPEWVGYGLFSLNAWIARMDTPPASLSLPLPGAGNGGLDPAHVQRMVTIYMTGAAQRGIEIRLLAEPLDAPDLPMIYAGIGSRATPDHILDLMHDIGAEAARSGWLLRSGAARGADSAFEAGSDSAGGTKEIFISRESDKVPHGILGTKDVHDRLVRQYHPRPSALSGFAYGLMARNGCQVFGAEFEAPASVICCYTKDSAGGGGTGQALRLAKAAGIGVIDLGRPELDGIRADEVMSIMAAEADKWREPRGFSSALVRDICPQI